MLDVSTPWGTITSSQIPSLRSVKNLFTKTSSKLSIFQHNHHHGPRRGK